MVPSVFFYLLPQMRFIAPLFSLALVLLCLCPLGFVGLLFSKWFAWKLAGGSRVPSFFAKPIEMIFMLFGLVLDCILIVKIPWVVLWYMKWFFGKFSLPARAAVAAGGYSV